MTETSLYRFLKIRRRHKRLGLRAIYSINTAREEFKFLFELIEELLREGHRKE